MRLNDRIKKDYLKIIDQKEMQWGWRNAFNWKEKIKIKRNKFQLKNKFNEKNIFNWKELIVLDCLLVTWLIEGIAQAKYFL